MKFSLQICCYLGHLNEFVGLCCFYLLNWCSFVLASYARFLWDAGEEVEDDDDDDDKEDGFDSFGEPYSSRPFDFGVQPLNSLL